MTLLACKINVPAMITAAEQDAHTDRVAAASDTELTASNRNTSATERPDEFIVVRVPPRHFAFRAGMHSCPRAHLAKMKISMTLFGLLEAFDDIQLAGPPLWEPGYKGRTLGRLNIRIRKIKPLQE